MDIVHVVKNNIHSDRVLLSIEWNNRFDYMQQHSGQHLLSSVFTNYLMEKLFDFILERNTYI